MTRQARKAWSPRAWFRSALRRALRAPREPHATPLTQHVVQGAQISAHRITTLNGKQLACWMVVPRRDGPSRPAVVQVMHGWGANASMMWPVVAPLVAAGLAVQLLDARCHGDSDDDEFTSMPRFAQDMWAGLQWLQKSRSVDPTRVALLGHSVGAAAALLLASEADPQVPRPPHPPRAVVSLSAFAHPEELMRRWLRQRLLPHRIVGRAILEHVQDIIGSRFETIAPLHTLPHVKAPVLLAHGLQDLTVPPEDARRLHRVAPRSELLLVDGDHDLRDALGPHVHALAGFLQARLQAPGTPGRHPSLHRQDTAGEPSPSGMPT